MRPPALLTATLLFGASLSLSGCYNDVDSFVVAKAKQDCRRMRECNPDQFEDNHRGDMGECRDDLEDAYFNLVETAENVGLEYDPDGGKECIAVSRDLHNDCSDRATLDIAEACDDLADF
jgi:hypothetical protein